MKLTMTKELEITVLKIKGDKDKDGDYTGDINSYLKLEYNIYGRKATNYVMISSIVLSDDLRYHSEVYDSDNEENEFEPDDNFYDFFKSLNNFIEVVIPELRKFAKDNKLPFRFRATDYYDTTEYESIYETIKNNIFSGEITKRWGEDELINNQMCIKWCIEGDILKLNNCILNKEYKIDLDDLEDSLSEALIDYNSKWNVEAIGKFNWN